MKKFFLLASFFLLLSSFVSADSLDAAQELASESIINIAPSDTDAVRYYRLNDLILRQEVLGIALRLRFETIDDNYRCQKYFRDTSEPWVCRSAEKAADLGIVTRNNTTFRPKSYLTLGEAMGIIIKALDIHLSEGATSTVADNIPTWQKRLILTITENNIQMDIRDSSGQIIALNGPIERSARIFEMSHRMTRGEFFQLVKALRQTTTNNTTSLDHCLTYTDGCNECFVNANGVAGCTKRACVWQGIPACYTCESGYILQNNRCVRDTVTSCKKEGEAVSNGSLPPQYQYHYSCCAGLSEVGPKEANIVGAPNICAKVGDKYCDSRYESSVNSSDCRTTSSFDVSICQGYNDGCNSCSHTTNGQDICTMMYCETPKNPYCTTYVPFGMSSQSADKIFLKKILSEIQSYTNNLSCDNSNQCKWKKVGSAPCGGASAAVPYSSKTIDEDLLTKKSTYYTDAEKLYNTTYGIMGICALMDEPIPMSCVNSVCR